MCMTFRSMFLAKTQTIVNSHRIGFASNGDYVVAVVPRFWFPEEIPAGVLDDSRILVVPAKGEREFYSIEDELPNHIKNSDDTKTWVKFSDKKLLEGGEPPEQNNDSDLINGLFNLLRNVNKDNLDETSFFSIHSKSTEFNTLLFRIIIDIVADDMRELRRSYKELKVKSSTIKGRIDFSSSIPLIAAQIPQMVCITEEFSLNAPHYSALMTAFDHIGNVAMDKDDSILKKIFEEIAEDALVTRAKFREIPSMTYGQAVRTLRSEALPPQLRQWSALFGFALLVLEDEGANLSSGDYNPRSVTYTAAQLWEDILFKVVKKAYKSETKVFHQDNLAMNNPWKKDVATGDENVERMDEGVESEKDSDKKKSYYRTKKPDIALTIKEKDVIIDAKYYKDIDSVMKGSSNYQMLAYALSGLYLDKKSTEPRYGSRKIAYVVPKHGKELISHGDTAYKRIDSPKEHRYKLQLPFTIAMNITDELESPPLRGMQMEFPSAGVYFDDEIHDKYYNRLSEAMKKVLDAYVDGEEE
jgi:5-methylcytosine-specific restriction endonuclease McrBC regulatory subunit McrC